MKLQRAALLVLVTMLPATALYSQTTPFTGAKVAMINTDVFDDEKGGITRLVNAYKALGVEFGPKQNELAAANAKIESLAREIQDLQEKLNNPPKGVPIVPETIRNSIIAKNEEGERLQVDLKRKQEDAKAQYEKRSKAVIGPISADIGNAMEGFAKAHGIDLILDTSKLAESGSILYLNAASDVTEVFIKEYNANHAAGR